MKVSKVTLIILGIVVLVIGFGVLYMMYTKQLQEQDTLKAKAAANQSRLTQIIGEQEKWKSQLATLQEQIAQKNQEVAAANAALVAAKSEWPDSAESIEYEERLFALADQWDLVTSVVTGGNPSTRNINGIGFTTTEFTITVTGQPLSSGFDEEDKYQEYVYQIVDDILGFLNELTKDSYFKTANIGSVNLTIPPLLSKEKLVDSGKNLAQPLATFTMTVYTY
jgi:hypothetical protein